MNGSIRPASAFSNRRRVSKRITDQEPLKTSPTRRRRLGSVAPPTKETTKNTQTITPDTQTNTPAVGNKTDEIKDFLLADENIDYSNYYYEDLNILDSNTPDQHNNSLPKVSIPSAFNVTVEISANRRGARRQQSRQPRRLQSRKISDLNNGLGSNNLRKNDIRKDAPRLSNVRNGERNKSKDILREFPIFRKFSEKHTDNLKLSLHERIENRRMQQNKNDLDDKIITIPVGTVPIGVVPVETIPVETVPVEVVPVGTVPVDTPKVSVDTPKVSLPIKKEIKVIKLSEEEVESIANGMKIEENTGETIKTNVTFSTSRSQKFDETADPYPDVLSLALLDGQLGNDPLGNAPFGYSPFGEAPLGENPFGDSPEGLAPLGNQSISLVINQTSETNNEKGDAEGRYHVQVTAPNGSINGNYVVVDPVTGDLNGVQYEVAQDVDPTIVQKALLNFLSLVPKRTLDFSKPAEDSLSEQILSAQSAHTESPPVVDAITTEAIILEIENTTVDIDIAAKS